MTNETRFIAYDALTWPEAAALPRATPMILPLGRGCSLEDLAHTLGNPPQVGLLPPIPFGWRGSGLSVSEDLLTALVKNLLASLRDDGFVNVFAMMPPGLDLGLGIEEITQKQLTPESFLPGEIFPTELDRSKVVLIPIGHTEQHGYHLPLSTDTLIIEAISKGTVIAALERATSLPVMPYGVSTHRSAFAGTLNTGGRPFEDFWLGVIDSLAASGFHMLYLISGHGGNCSFLNNVVKYAGERHRQMFCATAWLYLSGPHGIAALEKNRRSVQGGMGHACELETALILHLRPELVHMERVVDETNFITTPSYYMDWVEGGALVANPPWEDDTMSGAYGAGSLATREHGKIWLEAAIAEKAAHVEEIHEQFLRRLARRKERRLP